MKCSKCGEKYLYIRIYLNNPKRKPILFCERCGREWSICLQGRLLLTVLDAGNLDPLKSYVVPFADIA